MDYRLQLNAKAHLQYVYHPAWLGGKNIMRGIIRISEASYMVAHLVIIIITESCLTYV